MKRILIAMALTVGLLFSIFGCSTSTATNTDTGTIYVQTFTIAKTAEGVLKLAEKYRLAGTITEDQFSKVKTTYTALRAAEQVAAASAKGGTVDTTAITNAILDFTTAAMAAGIAWQGGN